MNLRQTREHVPHQRAARRVRQHVRVEPLGLARVVDPQHVGRVRRLGGAEVAGWSPLRTAGRDQGQEEKKRFRECGKPRQRSRERETAAGTSRSAHESNTLTGRAGPCNAARPRSAASEPRGIDAGSPAISDVEAPRRRDGRWYPGSRSPGPGGRRRRRRRPRATTVAGLYAFARQAGRSRRRRRGGWRDRWSSGAGAGDPAMPSRSTSEAPRRVGNVAVEIRGCAMNAPSPSPSRTRTLTVDGEAVLTPPATARSTSPSRSKSAATIESGRSSAG